MTWQAFKHDCKDSVAYSIAADVSTHFTDSAQLDAFIPVVNQDFQLLIELLKLVTMTETGVAKFLPSEFVIPFNKHKLPRKKKRWVYQ